VGVGATGAELERHPPCATGTELELSSYPPRAQHWAELELSAALSTGTELG